MGEGGEQKEREKGTEHTMKKKSLENLKEMPQLFHSKKVFLATSYSNRMVGAGVVIRIKKKIEIIFGLFILEFEI